jgi:hypothetical protein
MQPYPLALVLVAVRRIARTRLHRLLKYGCGFVLLSGCVIDHDTYVPPEIQFEETLNLGYRCGGALTSWTVYARETAEQGTAGCEQPILFLNLSPHTWYTFDITGYSGQSLCWQGTCQVNSGGGGRIFPDCSGVIAHLCGL